MSIFSILSQLTEQQIKAIVYYKWAQAYDSKALYKELSPDDILFAQAFDAYRKHTKEAMQIGGNQSTEGK